jgi:hypothetical protein
MRSDLERCYQHEAVSALDVSIASPVLILLIGPAPCA